MPGNYNSASSRLVEEVGTLARSRIKAFMRSAFRNKDRPAPAPAGRRHRAASAAGLARHVQRLDSADHGRVLLRIHRSGHCGVLANTAGAGRRQHKTCPVAQHVSATPRRVRRGRAKRHDGRHGGRHSQRLDEAGSLAADHEHAAKYVSAFNGRSATPRNRRRNSAIVPVIRWTRQQRRSAARSRARSAGGADIVMVKPAIGVHGHHRRVKDRFGVPVAAYNVSGEFAMVKARRRRGGLMSGAWRSKF